MQSIKGRASKAEKENARESCSYGSIQSVGLHHFGRELGPAGWESSAGLVLFRLASLCDPLEWSLSKWYVCWPDICDLVYEKGSPPSTSTSTMHYPLHTPCSILHTLDSRKVAPNKLERTLPMAAMQLIALYNVRFPVDITRILPQPVDVGMWERGAVGWP